MKVIIIWNFGRDKKISGNIRVGIEPRYYYDYVENKEITGGCLDAP